jgi:Na+-driven multidrug efflux pump
MSSTALSAHRVPLQSLVAFHLGKGDRRSAADVFRRTCSVAVFAGVIIMGALLASQTALPGIFTQDAAVIQQVKLVSDELFWRCPCTGIRCLLGYHLALHD